MNKIEHYTSLAFKDAMEKRRYDAGASLFLQDTKTTMETEFLKNDFHFENDEAKRDIYQITFTRGKRKWSFNFGQSINNSNGKTHPSEYDVLACLTKYEVGTFENFCSEFGYDEDSRTAERIYKAVCDEWANVQRIWSDKEINALQEIN